MDSMRMIEKLGTRKLEKTNTIVKNGANKPHKA